MEDKTNIDKKVIVFQLKDEEYAVPVACVGSIERMQSITRVPQTAEFVRGVINLRGVVTPIIDLRVRFGMQPAEDSESTRIIIVYIDEVEVGLVVDRDRKSTRLNSSHVAISYAVFCLKKKNDHRQARSPPGR